MFAACSLAAVVCGSENLAVYCPYTMFPESNYTLCFDAGDKRDLTDGKLCDPGKQLWTQKCGVGWSVGNFAPYKMVEITLDLKKNADFDRIVFSTALDSGVLLPTMINAEVSMDGKVFHTLGCVMANNRTSVPSGEKYTPVKIDAGFPAVNARYIRFRCVPQGYYLFMDEIEVYFSGKKQKVLRARDFPKSLSSDQFRKSIPRIKMENSIRRSYSRLLNDIVKQWDIPGSSSAVIQLEKEIRNWNSSGDPELMNVYYPIDALQRKIFALNGAQFRSSGYDSELIIRRAGSYDPVQPYWIPERKELSGNKLRMMNGEKRSMAFNVTNPAAEDVTLDVSLLRIPGRVFEVKYLDATSLDTTATVLHPLHGKVVIPSGMTVQLWIRLEPQEMQTGKHEGKLVLRSGSFQKVLPLILEISRLRFPQNVTLETALYDYLDFPSGSKFNWGLPRKFQDQMYQLKKDYHVNIAHGYSGLGGCNKPFLMKNGIFTDQEFKEFKDWAERNSDAKVLTVFMGVTPPVKFAEKYAWNDPGFEDAVAKWAACWRTALNTMRSVKDRVVFAIFDEPVSEKCYQVIHAWAKAFKKGFPEAVLEVNPLKIKTDFEKYFQYIDRVIFLADLLIENRNNERLLRDRFAAAGKEIGIYSCGCGPFNSDPAYYRNQAWYSFRFGAVSSGFWALSDGFLNRDQTANQYLLSCMYFAPVILNGDHYFTTKHLEAMREGIQDFEYLVLARAKLRLMKDDGSSPAEIRQLEKVLKQAVDTVCSQSRFGVENFVSPCSSAEKQRVRLLQILDRVQE